MSTMTTTDTIALEQYRSVESIASEWDELANRTNASPFLRPGWFAAWLSAFADGTRPVVYAARRDGRLVAVLPLLTGRRARSPTNSHTPVFDLLASDAEAARTIVYELLGVRFPQLDLTYLESGGALLRAWSELEGGR